jgi:hypothetical protein
MLAWRAAHKIKPKERKDFTTKHILSSEVEEAQTAPKDCAIKQFRNAIQGE